MAFFWCLEHNLWEVENILAISLRVSKTIIINRVVEEMEMWYIMYIYILGWWWWW